VWITAKSLVQDEISPVDNFVDNYPLPVDNPLSYPQLSTGWKKARLSTALSTAYSQLIHRVIHSYA
jgi:hypothetical protein